MKDEIMALYDKFVERSEKVLADPELIHNYGINRLRHTHGILMLRLPRRVGKTSFVIDAMTDVIRSKTNLVVVHDKRALRSFCRMIRKKREVSHSTNAAVDLDSSGYFEYMGIRIVTADEVRKDDDIKRGEYGTIFFDEHPKISDKTHMGCSSIFLEMNAERMVAVGT